jgi:hypothetical protein
VSHGFTTRGGWLVDAGGRHRLLRGVNLSGATKLPADPYLTTADGADQEAWREVSFVGRPAPLDEVDEHLARIASWGWNVLRLLTTWEAIEHAGPGQYDDAYLDYYAEVCRRAGDHGLLVFVDPHHDVWSRWTGGDGAPFWCFDLAGLVPARFEAAGAVALHAKDWPEHYHRVPVATMWTLFYAGDTYLPELAGVQGELQDRYIGAVAALAERLSSLENVLGYDTLNEPSHGYIGRDARSLQRARREFEQAGHPPFTPLEHLAAGDGVTVRRADGAVLNPDGVSIWRDGCPWRRSGLWDLDADGTPVLNQPDRFVVHGDGTPVHPWRDHNVPFVERFRERLRHAHPGCLLFVESSPWEPDTPWVDDDPLVVDARHWYDIATLATRRFDPGAYRPGLRGDRVIAGFDAIAEEFRAQLGALKTISNEGMGDLPMLIGEFGIPYEMNGGAAFTSGDFGLHEELLHAQYDALDALFLNATQWNYTPDNTHADGDRWNQEDLSVYCVEDGGGRAVRGFARPYARAAQGRPLRMSFEPASRRFELVLEPDVDLDAPTEVAVPAAQYPEGFDAEVSTGSFVHDPAAGLLRWWVDEEVDTATLTVTPRSPR